MKLVLAAVASAAVLTACAPGKTAPAPVTVTSAEWTKQAENVPRVGKTQRQANAAPSSKEPKRVDTRPGGGFSGWK